MNISCFLGVWFPIWLRPDNGDIAVTHSLRSPASISPNQISLVGLFIIASSDCEWCLANGFSIQICWLDATESQQGLSFLWRQQLRSGVNKREMTLLKYAFMAWLFLHLVRFVLILKVLKWNRDREAERGQERKKEDENKKLEYMCFKCDKTDKNEHAHPCIYLSVHPSIHKPFFACSFLFRGDRTKGDHDSPNESQEMSKWSQ